VSVYHHVGWALEQLGAADNCVERNPKKGVLRNYTKKRKENRMARKEEPGKQRGT